MGVRVLFEHVRICKGQYSGLTKGTPFLNWDFTQGVSASEKAQCFGCNLEALCARNPLYTHYFSDIADLFLARFNPAGPLKNDEFARQCGALRERLRALVNESARTALLKMVEAVEDGVLCWPRP